MDEVTAAFMPSIWNNIDIFAVEMKFKQLHFNINRLVMSKVSKELRKKIEEAYGQPVKYSQDCEALAMAIEERTGQRLGVSTLKRMFGFVGEQVVPRGSTMDIIAQFLGYDDMKDMACQTGEAYDISMFTPVDKEIESAKLEAGTQIQFTYDPKRLVVLTYIGDNYYIVNESQNSKLQKGDKVRITYLAVGFELMASDVIRNGESLGSYHSAKEGGLTTLEVVA